MTSDYEVLAVYETFVNPIPQNVAYTSYRVITNE